MDNPATKKTASALLVKILKDNGYSVTSARTHLFDLLWGREPQTMHELYTQSERDMNRASVYRVVELFEKLGIVHRVQIGWKYKVELSDIFAPHHHHISCLGCGRVIAVHDDERIELLIAEIAEQNHISNPTHQLEIQGYCEHCAQ